MGDWVETVYGPINATLLTQAQRVRLLICDVDGVLSNGLIYRDSRGEELKSFHVQDGYGIRLLQALGLEVALITGGTSRMVNDRAAMLGIEHLYQGQREKVTPFQQLLQRLQLTADQVAYIGDDLIDWPVLQQVGLAVAVTDAHPWLLPRVHYVTRKAGGQGAVRELCDLLLLAHQQFPGMELSPASSGGAIQ
ncbi:3-deoxy-manno-octulosonate-8-phosphatase KdsC [unidentified bacterial endosymbiont]|uniref:3-deoxy-manno-octulosonate-8-phosphatase KdsC n=1 Tax=unidentified bacterial endosymbiont TaxID=2355 RepID=UPI00209D225E|nr:3-deoxy-manno-octulosonate-8-phosphatase KdsC [unidentified bacterial endosymbiont]